MRGFERQRVWIADTGMRKISQYSEIIQGVLNKAGKFCEKTSGLEF